MFREHSPFPPRGILRRPPAAGRLTHARHLPAAALRDHVEHYWLVRWDLRGEPPFVQETLPHPSVHWVTEQGRSTVNGVARGRFTRALEGQGRVFGVKFKPGGFFGFHRAPVAALAGRGVTPAEAFGPDGDAVACALAALDGAADVARRAPDEALMDLVEPFLLARVPPPDPQLAAVQAMVAAAAQDRAITKVEALAARFGRSRRTVQRLFADYVGASPKWVIQRYRLHEALERVLAGDAARWAELALELGYFDQAHFIRDFRALVGASPAEYARSLRRGPPD